MKLESDGTKPDLDALLADAHEAVVRGVRTKHLPDKPEVRGRPHRGWLAAATVAWTLVLIALVNPPPSLRGAMPEPFRPPTGLEEASLRWGMWLAHGRVERFRQQADRIPTALSETGFDDAAITLVSRGDSYQLVGRTAGVELELGSGDNPDAFLGDAHQLLSGR